MKKTINIQKIFANSLNNIDLAIPGRVRSVLMKCGKDNCPCRDDLEKRHGPYFFWDRKVDGKLSSLSIPKELVPSFKKWICNRRKLEATVSKVLELSQKIAAEAKNTGN